MTNRSTSRHRWAANRAGRWLTESGIVAGLWFGAAAGLAEVAFLSLKRLLLGRLVFVPAFFWWSAPLVDAVIIAGFAALILALVPARLVRHRPALRFGLPLGVAAAGSILLVGGINRVALAALGIGIGLRGGAWLATRAPGVDRFFSRTLPVVTLVLPAGAAAWLGIPRGNRNPPAGTSPRRDLPNVLLIVLDTVRAIELSLYGAEEETTPAIDRVAATGVVFERAVSTAPWTLPSHASLFTGRWSHELSTDYDRPLDRTFPTLAETLSSLGYVTAGFVANEEYTTVETGLARGFDHYEDQPLTIGRVVHLTRLSRTIARWGRRLLRLPDDLPNRARADEINRRFLRWLDWQPPEPFFAFLNYYDAHAPYFPPPPEWRRFVGGATRRPVGIPMRSAWDPADATLRRRAYRGAIAYLDSRIGALLDSLESRGLRDRTLLILTSDHGEEFAEHDVMGHGNSLYLPGVHVPLAMVWPSRLPSGCRVPAPVSLREVPATILDLVGGPVGFPGLSLARYWGATPPESEEGPGVIYTSVMKARNLPPTYPVSRGAIAGAQRWPYRVVVELGDTMHPQLFSHQTDPMELHDLSREPWARPVIDELVDALAASGVMRARRPDLDSPVAPGRANDSVWTPSWGVLGTRCAPPTPAVGTRRRGD